jgi:hypothetical protein
VVQLVECVFNALICTLFLVNEVPDNAFVDFECGLDVFELIGKLSILILQVRDLHYALVLLRPR